MSLPHNKNLPYRVEPVRGIVVHTTGRRLSAIAAKNNPENLANGALQWYVSSGFQYYGNLVVAPDLTIDAMAPDEKATWHTRGLDRVYEQANWREFAYNNKEGKLQRHGRNTAVVYDWWDARWGEESSPVDLLGGRSINPVTWAIDLLPKEDGTYTENQLQLAAGLIAEKCVEFGLTEKAVFGHADIDPVRRGIVWGEAAVGRDWDPAIPDFLAFRELVGTMVRSRSCGE